MKAKFLVPVASAIAALSGESALANVEPQPKDAAKAVDTSGIAAKNDPITQNIAYQLGDESHSMLMRKSAAGVVYAQHQSHASHGSHGSHGSHRSGS